MSEIPNAGPKHATGSEPVRGREVTSGEGDGCVASGRSATRRQVLAFLGGAAALLSLGASRSRPGSGRQEGLRVGSVEDFSEDSVLLSDYYGLPLLLLRLEGDIAAVSGMCTHEGCLLTWNAERGIILCPCHGGEFDTTGKVLDGPPPAALLRFPVRIEQGEIYVLDPPYGDRDV